MDQAEQKQLGDAASQAFKYAQGFRQTIPKDYFGLARIQITDHQISGLFEGNSINLAESELASPHRGVRTTADLISLLRSVHSRLRDTSTLLDEGFLRDAMVLAANIGVTRDRLDFPIICDSAQILHFKNSQNLTFTPGALINGRFGIQAVASLNSTGMGDFIAVETKGSPHCRIFYHNLAGAN